MACAVCREHASKWSDTAHISNQNIDPARSEFTQVMNVRIHSGDGHVYSGWHSRLLLQVSSWMIDHEVFHIKSEEDQLVLILEKFSCVFLKKTPLNSLGWLIQKISLVKLQRCGGSSVDDPQIPQSQDHCSAWPAWNQSYRETVGHVGCKNKSTHVGMKTFYVYYRQVHFSQIPREHTMSRNWIKTNWGEVRKLLHIIA
jgi:hypothetical protein